MPAELAKALLEVHKKLKPIRRTATGQRGKYPGLPTVRKALIPLLAEHGLVYIEYATQHPDGRFVLAHKLVHIPSGEELGGEYPMHIGAAQQQGSEVTYARRYALMAITGAVAEGEDDDGESASEGRVSQRVRYADEDPQYRRLQRAVNAERPHTADSPPPGMWDGEDHWAEQPPGEFNGGRPGRKPRRNSGTLSPAEAIAVHLGRLGVTDRTDRLVKTSILAGRTELIESSKDLDDPTLQRISGELAKCKNADALKELLDRKRAEVPS